MDLVFKLNQVQAHIAKLRRQISVIDGQNQQSKSITDTDQWMYIILSTSTLQCSFIESFIYTFIFSASPVLQLFYILCLILFFFLVLNNFALDRKAKLLSVTSGNKIYFNCALYHSYFLTSYAIILSESIIALIYL